MNLPPKQQKQTISKPIEMIDSAGTKATIRAQGDEFRVDCDDYTFLCNDLGEALRKALYLLVLPLTVTEL